MSASSDRLFSLDFYLIDPSHVLDIQNRDFFIIFLELEIWGAVIASKEDHQHRIYHARLLLLLARVLSSYMRNSCPFLFSYIERVIILKNCLVVTSKDDYFIAVSYGIMKGSAIRPAFFSLSTSELNINLCQGTIELSPAKTYNISKSYLQRYRYHHQCST